MCFASIRLVQVVVLLLVVAAALFFVIPSGGAMNDPSAAMAELDGFLKNPESCASGGTQVKSVATRIRYSTGRVALKVQGDALPKRIDFAVIDIDRNERIATVVYKPPAGCNGISVNAAPYVLGFSMGARMTRPSLPRTRHRRSSATSGWACSRVGVSRSTPTPASESCAFPYSIWLPTRHRWTCRARKIAKARRQAVPSGPHQRCESQLQGPRAGSLARGSEVAQGAGGTLMATDAHRHRSAS